MEKGKKTGGRKKGTPNHLTTSIKSALAAAFDGLDGVEALQTWAMVNPTEFYRL